MNRLHPLITAMKEITTVATRKKKAKDPVRSYLSTCVSKIAAYLAVGKKEEAKVWAAQLVLWLKTQGLID